MIPLKTLPSFANKDVADLNNLLEFKFEQMGLFKPSSTRTYGGRKISTHYFTKRNGLECVRFNHSLVKSNGSNTFGEDIFIPIDDVYQATDIEHEFCLLNDSGVIVDSIKIYSNIKNKTELLKSEAKYAFNKLVESANILSVVANDSNVKDHMEFIFKYFDYEKNYWLQTGDGRIFHDRIKATTSQGANEALNYVLPIYTPKRIEDAIVEQLTRTKWINPNL